MIGLDLPGRAAALGITCADFVRLAESDPRIVAPPAFETAGAIFRLRRWLEAGRPDGDIDRLTFVGADEVRDVVIDVLRDLPTPWRHLAIEAAQWFEVGARTSGWCSVAPAPRALPGDRGHVIILAGSTRDRDLRGLIAHELSHAAHRIVIPDQSSATVPRTHRDAMAVFVDMDATEPPDANGARFDWRGAWVARRVATEILADRQAAAWGIPNRGPDAFELRRHFESIFDGAALAARAEGTTP